MLLPASLCGAAVWVLWGRRGDHGADVAYQSKLPGIVVVFATSSTAPCCCFAEARLGACSAAPAPHRSRQHSSSSFQSVFTQGSQLLPQHSSGFGGGGGSSCGREAALTSCFLRRLVILF